MNGVQNNMQATLSSGYNIPRIGFGVYKTPPKVTTDIVYEALKAGYRLIDSAELYGNEEEACAGIKKWLDEDPEKHKRSDVFYTTKIQNGNYGYEKTKKALDLSLERAQKIGYIDMVLLHSPMATSKERHGSWKALEEAVTRGKVLSIGVSNFGVKHLEQLLGFDDIHIQPVVDQVEIHPWLMREDISKFCKAHDIIIEAYSPLAKARKFQDPNLITISKKYGKTPAQILIRWSYQKGYIPLPKTVTKERLRPNLHIIDFSLSKEDINALECPDDYFITGWDPTVWTID